MAAAPAWAPPSSVTFFRAAGGAVRCRVNEGGGGPATARCDVPRLRRWAWIDEVGRAHAGRLTIHPLAPGAPIYRWGRQVGQCTVIRAGVRCQGDSEPRTFVATAHSVRLLR